MMEHEKNVMSEAFEREGFLFSESQIQKFYTFYQLLQEKNKVMNLTAITEFHDVVEKHFIDSLYLHRVVDFSEPLRILDLGTGAGFPGIPLKIAYPEIQITLLDSLQKRIFFLEEVIEKLGLSVVDTKHGRAEELARVSSYREAFDLCVSRAVANLSVLVEYALPFVRVGGTFISYKSGEINQEIKAAKHACFLLGGKITAIDRFSFSGNQRSLIVIEKIKRTPARYPRKAGVPSKSPIQ